MGLGERGNKTCPDLGFSHTQVGTPTKGCRGKSKGWEGPSLASEPPHRVTAPSCWPPAAKPMATAEAVWSRLALDGKPELELE